MLTQHFKYLTPKSRSVKFMTATAIALAAMTATPMAAQASPDFESIKTTEYSVKFNRAMLESDAGIQQVYLALQKKAKKACKIGKSISDDGDFLSKEACVNDMLNQFVRSADISTLTAYHMDKDKMGG